MPTTPERPARNDTRRAWAQECLASHAEATAVALARERYPLFGSDRLEVDASKTEERELGWLLYVQSECFLATREPSAEILDVQPIFVHRQTKAASWVKRYGPSDFVVDGAPGPDWPAAAVVVVPAAVVVAAVVWSSVWWGLALLARLIGFFPLYGIAFLFALVFAVIPVDRVVRTAHFRNFSPWFGVAVVVLGIVMAEIVLAVGGLAPPLALEFDGLGLSFDVPVEIAKLLGAIAMAAAGTGIGQSNKSSRHAWEASRLISAPADHEEV